LSANLKFFSNLAFSLFSIKFLISFSNFSSLNFVKSKPKILSKSSIKISFSLLPKSLSFTTCHRIDNAIGMFKSSLIAFKNSFLYFSKFVLLLNRFSFISFILFFNKLNEFLEPSSASFVNVKFDL